MSAMLERETELCLGLPGGSTSSKSTKRGFSETVDLELNLLQSDKSTAVDLNSLTTNESDVILSSSCKKDPIDETTPSKAQVVGWPPVRSFRKNAMAAEKAAFVKVSIDGAPYLRKVDLKMYKSYQQLSDALGKMFSAFTMGNYGSQGMIDFMNETKLMDVLNTSEYVPTYEDKDGDWMLVGDVPWE